MPMTAADVLNRIAEIIAQEGHQTVVKIDVDGRVYHIEAVRMHKEAHHVEWAEAAESRLALPRAQEKGT